MKARRKPAKRHATARPADNVNIARGTANTLDACAQKILFRALAHDLATANKLNRLGDQLAKMAGKLRR